jgi:hypothetical protein
MLIKFDCIKCGAEVVYETDMKIEPDKLCSSCKEKKQNKKKTHK